ncbi:MAG: hypothetical protein ACI4J6_13055 [Oscillospiraceae bacterium]
MSMMPMYKICPHCKRRYSYDPSTGSLGFICPHCGKPTADVSVRKTKQPIKEIKDLFKK